MNYPRTPFEIEAYNRLAELNSPVVAAHLHQWRRDGFANFNEMLIACIEGLVENVHEQHDFLFDILNTRVFPHLYVERL